MDQTAGGEVEQGRAEGHQVILGKISGLFGVHGWLRVYSYTRPLENILTYSPWYVRAAGKWEEHALLEGKNHGKGLIARLAGIKDRDSARALLGASIAVPREQLPEPHAGEHYYVDLIGLRVVNREGVELGQVQRILETSANDVLVVRGEREHLIPLVAGVHVLAIDENAGRIDVDWGIDY